MPRPPEHVRCKNFGCNKQSTQHKQLVAWPLAYEKCFLVVRCSGLHVAVFVWIWVWPIITYYDTFLNLENSMRFLRYFDPRYPEQTKPEAHGVCKSIRGTLQICTFVIHILIRSHAFIYLCDRYLHHILPNTLHSGLLVRRQDSFEMYIWKHVVTCQGAHTTNCRPFSTRRRSIGHVALTKRFPAWSFEAQDKVTTQV